MLRRLFKKYSSHFQMFTGAYELRKGTAILQAAEYDRLKAITRAAEPGNPALEGYKVYSQTDEDGIIAAICDRIGGNRTFVEIGVQTGIECNSLLLLLKNWRGTWIEGDPAACTKIESDLGAGSFPSRFRITHSFVTRENIVELLSSAIRFLDTDELGFFSLDIDGNDLHVMRALLSANIRPRAICVEYQGKFPPPVSVTVDYDPHHVWDLSDYMGSSLQAFVDLFAEFDYRLVTCNLPGINAFFVRNDLVGAFPEIAVDRLYQPYRAYLSPMSAGHAPSLGYLKTALNRSS